MKKFVAAALILLLGLQVSHAQNGDIHFRELSGFTKTEARRTIKIPDIMGYKTLKGDFHMHTIFSDGIVLPSERVREAWTEGLDVIAITDHTTPQPNYVIADYNTAYKMAVNTAERYGITLIPATEYTKSEPVGHLNFLFIEDANPYAGDALTTYEAIEDAASKGAFIIYNHPGWPDKNSDLDKFHIDFINQGKIHGIEVVNGNEFYPVVLDYRKQYDIAVFSNTDIHRPIHANYELGDKFRNITLVFAKDNSAEAVKEAMFAKRTLAFADNMLMGNADFISEILKKSLVVSQLKMDDFGFSCLVTNVSDISYHLEGPNHKYISFPANRTVILRESTVNINQVFKVNNTWISSQQHLEIPLTFIITAEDEVMMPFTRQNLVNIDPTAKIEVFGTTAGAEVFYTLDGSEPTTNSVKYTQPFAISKSAQLKIKAFKQGLKPSRTYKSHVLLNSMHMAEKPGSLSNGLKYSYYEGEFSSATEMEQKGKFVKEGIVDFPDISPTEKEDYFGFVFTGYLFVPQNGKYTFSLESDDGSILYIAGVQLINNDGSRSLKKDSGTINLQKGYHPIEIRYFDDYDEHELRLFWTAPNGKEALVDSKNYFHKK
jgi:predicted metal-dependent phosphoesterase TrpH